MKVLRVSILLLFFLGLSIVPKSTFAASSVASSNGAIENKVDSLTQAAALCLGGDCSEFDSEISKSDEDGCIIYASMLSLDEPTVCDPNKDIKDLIEKLRQKLRGLGDWTLKGLWDDVIKKWLESLGITDLPGGLGLKCSGEETLKKLSERVKKGIDDYFRNKTPEEKLKKLRELLEALKKDGNKKIKDEVDKLLTELDLLKQKLADPNLSPEDRQKIIDRINTIIEELKRLMDDLIRRPASTAPQAGVAVIVEAEPPIDEEICQELYYS